MKINVKHISSAVIFIILILGVNTGHAAAKLYVVGSGSVYVGNTTTNTFYPGNLCCFGSSTGVAFQPATNKVYVANPGGNSVAVINALTDLQLFSTGPPIPILVGTNPSAIGVHAPSSRVYVVNSGSADISVINSTKDTVTTTIPLTLAVTPVAIGIHSGSLQAYVANQGSNTVSVVDLATNTLVTSIPVGAQPAGIALFEAGNKAYVSNSADSTVSVINTLTNTVMNTINLGAGRGPQGLAFDPSSNRILVANFSSNSVVSIDPANDTFFELTAGMGTGPASISVDTTGQKFYVAFESSGEVRGFDSLTGANTSVQPTAFLTAIAVAQVPDPVISVSPPSHNFAGVTLNPIPPPAVVFTLSNSGAAPLRIDNISLSGATEYTLDLNGGGNPCVGFFPVFVPAAGNCTVSVSFNPTTNANFPASLAITSRDPLNPSLSLPITGVGTNSCSWLTATSGNWSNAANWSCTAVPGLFDDALITVGGANYTVTVDVISEVNSITMTGTTGWTNTFAVALNSPIIIHNASTFGTDTALDLVGGDVTALGDISAQTVNWSGGQLSGAGVMNIANLNLMPAAGSLVVNGKTMNVNNTAHQGGLLQIGLGSVFNNLGSYNLQIDGGGIIRDYGVTGAGVFNNTINGMFSIIIGAVGTGQATSLIPFNNDGIVEVLSGTFGLFGNGIHTGTFLTASATESFLFSGGTHTLSAENALSGTGLYRVNGGNVSITYAPLPTAAVTTNIALDSGTLSITGAPVTTLTMIGGTLTNAGNHTVQTFNWDGGTVNGPGTIFPTSLNMTGAGQRILDGTILDVSGLVVHNGGDLVLDNGSQFLNRGTYGLNLDTLTAISTSGAPGTFYNYGTFNKNAVAVPPTNTPGINVPFVNYGTMQITGDVSTLANMQSLNVTNLANYGHLNATGTVTISGPLNVDLGTFVPAAGNTFTLITCGVLCTGSFSSLNVTPPAGLPWAVGYKPTSVVLAATLPPTISASTPLAGAVNVPVNAPVTVTFSSQMDPATVTPATVSVSSAAGALAFSSFLYSPGTGILTITPAAPLQANTTYTVTVLGSVADLNGVIMGTPQSWTFATACPVISLIPATLAGGSVGTTYNQTLSAVGGVAPYTYTLTAGALPAGLTLSATGVLSGTPTLQGVFNFTITATDANLCAGVQGFTLTVNPPLCGTITLAPAALPNSVINSAYVLSLTAAGGTAPYTYTLTAGALPTGLGLAAAGLLSGTPTVSGAFNFTVTATDAITCSGAQAFSLTVAPPPCGTISLSPSTLPNAAVGSAYTQTINAFGGNAPYIFSAIGGMPAGLALSPSGQISGTPTTAGTYNIAIDVTDATLCTGAWSYALIVGSPACGTISVAPATLPGGMATKPYSQSLTASGGTAPYVYTLATGALPYGLTLAQDGVISGTPDTTGPFAFSVSVHDSAGCTGSANYGIAVSPLSYYFGISKTGPGIIISSPPGINCGTLCGNSFLPNTRITLLFVPDTGSRVTDVTLDGVSLGPVNTITIREIMADQTLGVTFGQ